MRTSVRIGALVASVAALICANAIAGSMTATPITIDKATAPDVITLPDITVTGGPNSSCTFDSGSNGSYRWRVTATDGSTFGNSVSEWWQFTFVN